MLRHALSTAAVLALAACGSADAPLVENDAAPTAAVTAPVDPLGAAVDHPRRDSDRARDQFRNPRETLEFFGLEPGMDVAEIWPGYYAEILAPYADATGGTYTAVLFPDNNERFQARNTAFRERFGDTDAYGDVRYGSFGYDNGRKLGEIAPDGSLDMILTFRNVHNWMGRDFAEEAFGDFAAALRPGGVLGVVEHRLPETRTQDPTGRTGYVQESYMKDLAERAGFEFVGSSEVNANPRDTADHPFGVWTLPPSSRTPDDDGADAQDFDAELYRNIGESDRATLLFRKPE